MSKACKTLSVLVGIIGIIGSFIIAKRFGMEDTVSIYSRYADSRDWGLTIGIFLGGIISTAIPTIGLYAVGEILDRVNNLEYAIDDLQYSMKSKEQVNPYSNGIKVSNAKIDILNKSERNQENWICPKCGTLNTISSRFCKDCGYYQ